MKKYVKLLRVKHYVKNCLIYLAIFFSGNVRDISLFLKCTLGFISFCALSSGIYIYNDIQDYEKDRLHPLKKNRPIASGEISKENAWVLFLVCIVLTYSLSYIISETYGFVCEAIYLILNLLYSRGLKNYPLIDIGILSSGFVIRVVYGGVITDIKLSDWLILVILSGALFMGFGKRKKEMDLNMNVRTVLGAYTDSFLNQSVYVCLTLVIVFYSLWTTNIDNNRMIWTIPFIIFIVFRYSLDREKR